MPLHTFVLALALALAGTAQAQLSSPLPPGAAKSQKPAAPLGSIDLPAGSGAGVHGANSPFPQLQERADVVPWSTLTAIKTRVEKNRILPVFTPPVLALNQKTQRIQGFMMPLEPGEKQRHFLLSSVPLSCSFCLPGGPESMVEVRTKTPVKYSMEIVVVEGTFAVLNDDPYGLYYRMTDAVGAK
ncbi:MAG: DUF3299 domain-containing protein [Pseudomonadota bacterium]